MKICDCQNENFSFFHGVNTSFKEGIGDKLGKESGFSLLFFVNGGAVVKTAKGMEQLKNMHQLKNNSKYIMSWKISSNIHCKT